MDARSLISYATHQGLISLNPPPRDGTRRPTQWIPPKKITNGCTGYRKERQLPVWPDDPEDLRALWGKFSHREKSIIVMARLRAERRGEDTRMFPPRLRKRKNLTSVGASTKQLMTRERHSSDSNSMGLLCAAQQGSLRGGNPRADVLTHG